MPGDLADILPPLPQCPAMHLDGRQRAAQVFLSRNALVEDPVGALQAERDIAAWTPAERRVFLDKFLQFPKVS